MNSLSLALLATLTAAPFAAWANVNPDFADDATPILRTQPGLLQYVENHYEVKETGLAKYPGTDDRRPSPPYIFNARPVGSHGKFNLRLLIQPGSAGHILGVVDITKAKVNPPPDRPFGQPSAPPQLGQAPVASSPNVQVPSLSATPEATHPAPASSAPSMAQPPAAASQPSEPTADTPSGPIPNSNNASPAPTSNQPSLSPPADPVPPAQ